MQTTIFVTKVTLPEEKGQTLLLVGLRPQLRMEHVSRRTYKDPEWILQLKKDNLEPAQEFL